MTCNIVNELKNKICLSIMARASYYFLFISLLHYSLSSHSLRTTEAGYEYDTALFVFGDSIVDNGNNNFLKNCSAKSNYKPYGVDFELGASGRFTNKGNPGDIMGELLGLPHYLPIFMDPNAKGEKIIHGVNYGSAGAGILDTTFITSNIIPMNQQIKNFATVTRPDLLSQLGEEELSSYLSKSIFMFNVGGNDFQSICFESTTDHCDYTELSGTLIAEYTTQLKFLHSLGGRKFVLFAQNMLGCAPRARHSCSMECCETQNEAALTFNSKLRSSIDVFMTEMAGAYFVYVDSYYIMKDVLDNPSALGIKVIDSPCCELDKSAANITCLSGGTACSDRSVYAYFDGVHPTDRLYKNLSTKAFYSENLTEVYPFNVKTLLNLTTTESFVSDLQPTQTLATDI